MNRQNNFTDMLRDLRGDTPVKELAAMAGLAPTTLYNAESGVNVSWSTIERSYATRCKSDEEYCKLLIAWVVTQSERPISFGEASREMKDTLARANRENSREIGRVVDQLGETPPPDLRLITRFIESFRTNPHTRAMTKAWLESISSLPPRREDRPRE